MPLKAGNPEFVGPGTCSKRSWYGERVKKIVFFIFSSRPMQVARVDIGFSKKEASKAVVDVENRMPSKSNVPP